jgi:hypothetical protein
MNNIDKQYTALLQDILDNGSAKSNQTNYNNIQQYIRMNIKATELRIGNYIKLMFNYEDYEAIQVTSDELVMVDKKQADYEPLPLTEEWLFKFGFNHIDKSDNDYITYTDSNHEYYLQLDVRRKDGKYSILDNSFDDLRDFSMVDIMYVHQLQNMYFALTGEELILNNNTYSIPIYENGMKTEWTVYGVVGDEKYFKLLELGNGKGLPDMINTTIKQ